MTSDLYDQLIMNNNMAKKITYLNILLFASFFLSASEADPEISCVYRESCMLPCQFRIASDPLIHWYKVSAGDSLVHSYYNDQDQLDHQDQNFKDRTSLLLDQISRGNASLLLKEVKIQDEGRYKCYTSTIRGFEESFVNMKTEAPVSNVSIYLMENRIICSSEGIYPHPELTWSTIPPSNIALENRTTVHQTEEQLYRIISSLHVSNNKPDLIYSCTVRTRLNSMMANFSKPAASHQNEDSSWKVIVVPIAAAAAIAAIIGVVVYVSCKKKKNSGSRSKPGDSTELNGRNDDSITEDRHEEELLKTQEHRTTDNKTTTHSIIRLDVDS